MYLATLGSCGIRFNPGLGSGGTEKTNVGGPAASFGIWHSEKDIVKSIADQYGVTVKRIHTHIGSGSDPDVWIKAASMSLALVEFFSGVTALNLGESFILSTVLLDYLNCFLYRRWFQGGANPSRAFCRLKANWTTYQRGIREDLNNFSLFLLLLTFLLM